MSKNLLKPNKNPNDIEELPKIFTSPLRTFQPGMSCIAFLNLAD